MRRYSPEYCALYSSVHLSVIGKFLWNLGFSQSYKVCHLFLHVYQAYRVFTHICKVAHGLPDREEMHSYHWVGGTFPKDIGANVQEESCGTCTSLSEIVEQFSKIHHSVCSVVWHIKGDLTSLEFLLVTKSNEELHHKYFIWTWVLIASFLLRGKKGY